MTSSEKREDELNYYPVRFLEVEEHLMRGGGEGGGTPIYWF